MKNLYPLIWFLLVIISSVSYSQDTAIIQSRDLVADVIPDDTTICIGDSVLLTVIAEGGVPPYTYLWWNGATDQSVYVCPEVTTEYQVQVTDSETRG